MHSMQELIIPPSPSISTLNYIPLICKPECKMRNLEPSPVPGIIGAESSFIVCLDLLPELCEKLTCSNLPESILSTFSIPQTIKC